MIETYLSKLDVNLQALNPFSLAKSRSIVNLHISEETKDKDSTLINGNYSNILRLSTGEHIGYQFSHDYSVISIYSLHDAITGRTLVVHLPHKTFNEHYTFTIYEGDQCISMDLILKTGIFLNLKFSLDYIFSRLKTLAENWYTLLNPYDFTVRLPKYLYKVDNSLSVVLLNDGGLLGLKNTKANNSDLYDLQPVLFNDNSYFQSFTRFFSKHDTGSENVVSCKVYAKYFLITLTENCKLRVWDLRSNSMVLQLDLISNPQDKHRQYDSMGPYLSILNNLLTVFLPLGNGAFQVFQLLVKNDNLLHIIPRTKIPISTNLSISSIWSLVDIQLTKPFDLNLESSFIQLAVLWKSNTSIKLQILNFHDESLKSFEWIETSNKSLPDLLDYQDLLTNGNTDQALLNLKSHYTPSLFEKAHNMLSSNGIVLLPNQPNNQEYLSNLESILKDLNKHHDEPSSLTLYNDEVLVINTLHLYNHFVYKINSTLETYYYNLTNEIEMFSDDLYTYMQVVNGFVSTLSSDIVMRIGTQLYGIMTHEIDDSLSLKDKFTVIFKSSLESQFQSSNLKKLFEQLTSLDVVSILNNFIDNHLNSSASFASIISSMKFDNFSSVTILESTHQRVLIENKFIVDTLLIFTLLDFDYSMLESQLKVLLKTHYNQSLWLQLYKLDKSLLLSEIFVATSKYGYGSMVTSYSDLSMYTNHILTYIADSSVSRNPLLTASYSKWVVHPKSNSITRNPNLFLDTVLSNFYIRDDTLHQFMVGLSQYQCGRYEEAYGFLSHSAVIDIKLDQLPQCLSSLTKHPEHPLHNLIVSLEMSENGAGYYYQLSKLFSDVRSFAYALKSIKKSIALGDGKDSTSTFKIKQLTQFLDTLIIFSEFEEVLDVLKLEHSILDKGIRSAYYGKLLSDQQYRDKFIATLFRLCSENTDKLFLTMDDFVIIDQLLQTQLDTNVWCTYKKLFCYRMLNQHERDAAQILYDYLIHGTDPELKQRCHWIIVNVLSSFADPNDQWIINTNNHGQVLYLSDIRSEMKAVGTM
ncbi:Nup120p Ecym_4564 [Eremothecium cymbalariae DBVPG|uniref:Nucleoporin Nup120/160 n=1 Tax=Eremothecium cymbalariae (strain CBS 270.75 / DBVPG 7215 / KCTC 17166 / NRRL Y-17582) TaxID=931890 RepID=G8JS75_ERECY|nr:hypothetical protein Ecym_4564 [Eremothecium cymbalariae DBVPG\